MNHLLFRAFSLRGILGITNKNNVLITNNAKNNCQ